ncbi:hypothetical protein Cni_G04004 [Canna indica]|uniref:Reduced growth phenotype protein 1 n=1 Tax=Canna indica TaxID=4628 RepID=A0AAQ3JUP5_9LILI|nr:hypothetical protein Cni_G04004 [Canna indica]
METSQKGFSFFRSIGWFDAKKSDLCNKHDISPSVKIQLDKDTYRPGDSVIATVEICSPQISNGYPDRENFTKQHSSFLLDNFSFEIMGIEKLDCQWFATQKLSPGSRQRRGERLFLDCTAPSIVSKVIISSGCSKTYMIRIELPKVLPPSYRGISIRYIYYVRGTITGSWFILENNDHSGRHSNDLIQVEARTPLQIWISQKNNLLTEDGNLAIIADQLDMLWKEKDTDSEWVRANENLDVLEEGYDSSRDEVSSVSSYNPSRGNPDLPHHRSSLSLQSITSRLSNNDFHQIQTDRTVIPPYIPAQLSIAEVIDDPAAGVMSSGDNTNDSLPTLSPSLQRTLQESKSPKDDTVSPYTPKTFESSASEGFVRGRSYNIRMDDQILLRFYPKNSDSTCYFGDTIGGTLTFFHGGARRCLEVAVTLEISETITQRFVHPSRRSSPTITKVHSEHHEVVVDLVQTSFLFSIPTDGPMSFSTSKVSVQWSLRFEFFTTPKDLDLTRYAHPLLVEQREKGEWVIPITVHPPPLRIQAARMINEKSLTLGNLFHA